MAVNYLKETLLIRVRPNYQRLISPRPLDVPHELCEVGHAHPVRIVTVRQQQL
jgi:hypothetical protein